jgi:archaellum component FlaC
MEPRRNLIKSLIGDISLLEDRVSQFEDEIADRRQRAGENSEEVEQLEFLVDSLKGLKEDLSKKRSLIEQASSTITGCLHRNVNPFNREWNLKTKKEN